MDTTGESSALNSFYLALQFFSCKNWSMVCSGVKWKTSGRQGWMEGGWAWSNAKLFLKRRQIQLGRGKKGFRDEEKIMRWFLRWLLLLSIFSRLIHFCLRSGWFNVQIYWSRRPLWCSQLRMELEWAPCAEASGVLALRRMWTPGRFQTGICLGWTSILVTGVL